MSQKEDLQRAARLKVQGVSQRGIADALGLSDSEVSLLCSSEEFERVYRDLAGAVVEANSAFDESWDGIERQALGVVATNLKWNKDPEFALKAAVVANKAQRRNGRAGMLNLAASNGSTVQLNLSQHFVQYLTGGGQANNGLGERGPIEQKRVDMPTVKEVHALLKAPADAEFDSMLSEAFADAVP